MTATLIALLLAAPAAAAAYDAKPRPKFMTRLEWAVAMCETGMNWRHSTSDYAGAYGFARSSWDAFAPRGYPAEPEQASPWQQTVVARRIRARYGWSGWGCFTHGGYRVWLSRSR